jgi:hypothetical protein
MFYAPVTSSPFNGLFYHLRSPRELYKFVMPDSIRHPVIFCRMLACVRMPMWIPFDYKKRKQDVI